MGRLEDLIDQKALPAQAKEELKTILRDYGQNGDKAEAKQRMLDVFNKPENEAAKVQVGIVQREFEHIVEAPDHSHQKKL